MPGAEGGGQTHAQRLCEYRDQLAGASSLSFVVMHGVAHLNLLSHLQGPLKIKDITFLLVVVVVVVRFLLWFSFFDFCFVLRQDLGSPR